MFRHHVCTVVFDIVSVLECSDVFVTVSVLEYICTGVFCIVSVLVGIHTPVCLMLCVLQCFNASMSRPLSYRHVWWACGPACTH